MSSKTEYESYLTGVGEERERIITLLEGYANAKCDEYCSYRCECFGKHEAQTFIALIKDPTRNITSEILPDGSIYIEEIKGENK